VSRPKTRTWAVAAVSVASQAAASAHAKGVRAAWQQHARTRAIRDCEHSGVDDEGPGPGLSWLQSSEAPRKRRASAGGAHLSSQGPCSSAAPPGGGETNASTTQSLATEPTLVTMTRSSRAAEAPPASSAARPCVPAQAYVKLVSEGRTRGTQHGAAEVGVRDAAVVREVKIARIARGDVGVVQAWPGAARRATARQ